MINARPHQKTPVPLAPWMLPPVLALIAEATSLEAAITVAWALGGQRVYFPSARFHPSNQVVSAIGVDAARRLAKVLGGTTVDVPHARAVLRRHEARRLRAGDHSLGAIARELGVTRGHVARLLAPGSERRFLPKEMPG